MTLSIIGAGFGRTGTLSLKLALEQLGFGRCYHMTEVFSLPAAPGQFERAAMGEPVDWDEVFKGYGATVDWPACAFYHELAAAYPAAKVILTVRDAESWFRSTQETIFEGLEEMVKDTASPWARMAKRVIYDRFDGRIHDRATCIAVFEAHNAAVKAAFPKERLLVYEAREGWGPLCAFLGEAVPATPFPKVNTREDFRKMLASVGRPGAPRGH